jgi:DNA-binding MarR family transcriptional regulator
MEHTNDNIYRSVLKSAYTLRILLKIHNGYRPSQIAESLDISQQNLYYYTNQLIDAKLIEKLSTEHGLEWKLTERGQFILKENLSRSVNRNRNNSNNNTPTIQQHNTIPIRMHNVTFSFDILSGIEENIRLRWKPINNGVSKCFIKYPDHTLELTKSSNENESVLEVHLSEVYTFDPYQGVLKQYDTARHYASLAAQRLRLVVSDNGRLVKKPHLAFERDLIALYLATFQIAEIGTIEEGGRKDKVWIDSSKGSGELETNDINYAYKYLMMPEIVMDIEKAVNKIARQTAGYERYYHPIKSVLLKVITISRSSF